LEVRKFHISHADGHTMRLEHFVPDRSLTTGRIRLDILTAMRKISRKIKDDFIAPTKAWNHDPKIYSREGIAAGRAYIEIYADDPVYGILDQGVDFGAHVIVPKNKRVLRFAGTYIAKTSPGTLTSRMGGKSGGYGYAKIIRNWGIKPRNFVEQIETKWSGGKFHTEISEALFDVAMSSGFFMEDDGNAD
jgi:hypothetical protein